MQLLLNHKTPIDTHRVDPVLNNDLPSVSVVIPCFNAADFIARALDSVSTQTIMPEQVICVDDGSTDCTRDVLAEYEKQSPIPLELYFVEHAGAPSARNLGLEKSKSNFVQFLDADDELLPAKLEGQLELATRLGAVDFVAGSFLRSATYGTEDFKHPKYTDPWRNLISGELGITSANLWRKSSLLSVGGWNESLTSSQEYDLMFRLMKQGARPLLSHEPLTIKHFNPHGIQGGAGSKSERRIRSLLNYIELRKRIVQHLVDKEMMDAERQKVYQLTIHLRCVELVGLEPELARRIYAETVPPDSYVRLNRLLEHGTDGR
jgi:glycosyltransferase involved in cell wall biosynthesis